ncbi:hypothetical protein [Kineosporia sp. R_H_3]|uniref:hypothetical protein n=1 Tax=Kineosporia sp. R_H_3 TaxID=1961848 RepID=UPI000B4B52EB|nr:hypothetical protein [Kineosporia sp. R_H_3]
MTDTTQISRAQLGNPIDSEEYVQAVLDDLDNNDLTELYDLSDEAVRAVLAVLDDLGVGPAVAMVRFNRIAAEPPAPPTRTEVLALVDDLITAAGEHRKARLDEAAARRDMHTGALTDAITQSRKALAAEQAAAAALRAAITVAVPA